ncbi:MobC family plasmid mobilization relaxosome protein [Brevibacterium oceani]|uniref:MobC family plasmid mobilization relaxosome protein n=1 Tax=Brevibacterium oceani TaxID=358099 RepID=UPI0015E6485C|nr:MobC family plasmid mobilization relaxosome protein [Brevibacterium oceani]
MSERKRQANVTGGRQVRREVTLTPVQDGQLVVAAERAGRTVPAFLVEAGLKAGGYQTETERRENIFALFQLREQLARIGNNVNQMAKLLNAEGEVDTDLRATLAAVREKISAVDEVVTLFAAEAEEA